MAATLAELQALQAIGRLKAAYCRLLDSKDWQGYGALFTADAGINVDDDIVLFSEHGFPLPSSAREATRKVVGGPSLAKFVSGTVGNARTVHQVHMPEIDFLSESEATGVWAMTDIVEQSTVMLRGAGHYRESYRLVSGEWRIASLRLTRLRIDFYEPGEDGRWRQILPRRGA